MSKEKFKIIIISPSQKNIVGGVERFCYLLQDILKKDHDVNIVGKEDIEDKFFYRIFKNIPGINLIILGYYLGKLADGLNPGLVITNGLYGFSAKTKSLNIQHGTFARASDRMDKNLFKKLIRKYLWGYFEKKAVLKAQKVVAVSYETKESIERYYKRKDVEVILNAVDEKLFSKKDKIEARKIFNLPLDKKIVLFVGRLSKQKSPEIIFELAKRFEKEGINFVLATDRILKWKLPNVIFLLNVSYEKLPYLYSACDVFILPSKHEGCAFTLIEAMSCQTPFVISNVGCAYEIKHFSSLFERFIVDNLSADTFYIKIKEVLNLREEELTKYKNLEKEFINKFANLKVFESEYINLIKNLIK